jgi:hypothetical protein
MKRSRFRGDASGQAMTEFAMVFPIFILIVFGVISLGLTAFYQQQVQNAARQAARFASIHSSSSQCPVSSNDPFLSPPEFSYFACDPAPTWPAMTLFARQNFWGQSNALRISACWSSFHKPGLPAQYDQPPIDPATGSENELGKCTYWKYDTDPGALACPTASTTQADDEGTNRAGNYVTVYACMQWQPPFAGFLLIPQQVTIRSVVTELIERQQ